MLEHERTGYGETLIIGDGDIMVPEMKLTTWYQKRI